MNKAQGTISGKSKKVAKNTLLLYVRMLMLMLIGLFTSRVILKVLGVADFGTYNAVYSVVMMFTALSNSVGSPISRFLAFELGASDPLKLKKVFSSSIAIQMGLAVLLVILAETLGLWYLNGHLELPEGRQDAAFWVFQISVLMLCVQLFSIPFNSLIVAHEDIKVFAWISIFEAVMKLSVALIISFTSFDKLIVYASLLLVVAFVTRGAYAWYCKRNYEEARGPFTPDRQILKSMLTFSAWASMAQGIGVFNTQGVNLLTNSFFGVSLNAVRGVAGQIENIVTQLTTNFLTALNPLITKTWAEGNREYCYAMVRKGCKFCFLIVMFFAIPFMFESSFILGLWLEEVPPLADRFTSLAIFCVMMNFMSNSLAQLIISEGRVGKYYIITSAITILTFVGTYIAFSLGYGAEMPYYISMAVFFLSAAARLVLAWKQCLFPVKEFIREVAVPSAVTLAISVLLSWAVFSLVDNPWIVIACSLLVMGVCSFFIALTGGEKSYLLQSARKVFRLNAEK